MLGNKLPISKNTDPAKVDDWSPFENLRREIDRLFDEWRLPSRFLGFDVPRLSNVAGTLVPATDIAEKDDCYEITAELPGLDEKDVEVSLANGTLTIKGEKSENKEEKQKGYYLSERRYGSFQRSFRIPEGVDADKIEASFAKGVLTVKLPKTAEAKAEKKIAINAG
ncbi:Hsp20/alpha crystallin family protein [Chelativorans composti]|jgi:Molecular chaperone (small heat shock protein)|uniref:Hsp20/alpha crystallin family protein n=1 Tax=Chelativorans composti TaxID=768533 RepID=A0ABW5DDX7_9HYPH